MIPHPRPNQQDQFYVTNDVVLQVLLPRHTQLCVPACINIPAFPP